MNAQKTVRPALDWSKLVKPTMKLRCQHVSQQTGDLGSYPVAGTLILPRINDAGEEELHLLLVLFRERTFKRGVPYEQCLFPVSVKGHYPYLPLAYAETQRQIYYKPSLKLREGTWCVEWLESANQNPEA